MDQVLVFASGRRPQACHHGHPWRAGRGDYRASWFTCACRIAQAHAFGHHVLRCATDGCTSHWTGPEHDPGTALPDH
jgi:hypothetical protein